jgi:hypothetical protein
MRVPGELDALSDLCALSDSGGRFAQDSSDCSKIGNATERIKCQIDTQIVKNEADGKKENEMTR